MLKRLHLRQFIALCETGGFTRAAQRLRVTQPTLSAGIAELERQMGVPLLIRNRRALRPTEAGLRLLHHARTIEREFHLAESNVGKAPAPDAPLRLGLLPSIGTHWIAQLAAGYRGTAPLDLIEGGDTDLRRRLNVGKLDAALTLLRPGQDAPVLFDEPYVLILSVAHPLAGRSEIVPAELTHETMIARRSCEILAETSRFFIAHAIRPHFALRSPNDDRCLALVRAGVAVTTGPLSLVDDGLVGVRVTGYDYQRRIGLIAALGQEARIVASGLSGQLHELRRGAG